MGLEAEVDLRSGILRCIDSALGVLGDASRELVYSYLAQNDLSRETIPDEPWKFVEILKKLFGQGEEILERTMLIELKRSYGISSSGVALVEVLAAMRLRKDSSAVHQGSSEHAIKPRKSTHHRVV